MQYRRDGKASGTGRNWGVFCGSNMIKPRPTRPLLWNLPGWTPNMINSLSTCFDCILDPIRNLINLGFCWTLGTKTAIRSQTTSTHYLCVRLAKLSTLSWCQWVVSNGIHDMPRFAWDIATNPSLLCYSPCSGDFWVVSCFLGMPFYAHLETAQNISKLYPQEMEWSMTDLIHCNHMLVIVL